MSGPKPLTHEQRMTRWGRRIAIDPKKGCWIWLGTVDHHGYAKGLRSRGEGTRLVRLHRVFYEHFVGPVPAGRVLHHMCEVKHCIYPRHLKPVSRGQHLAEHGFVGAHKSAERSKALTHCKRGHPWDEANTYVAKNGDRFCRACGRLRANRLWAEGRYSRQKR